MPTEKRLVIRIALCQLQSHPALCTGHVDWLEEPFMGRPEVTLGSLAAKGVDVGAVQQECRKRYLAWQSNRLDAVLAFLGGIEPAPNLVVFPEGSIPATSLPELDRWAKSRGAYVLGGTHAYQRSPESLRAYDELKIPANALKKLPNTSGLSVLALLDPVRNNKLVPKRIISPFERSPILSKGPAAPPDPEVFRMSVGGRHFGVLALVCSEALQEHTVRKAYGPCCLLSCDHKPQQFSSFLEMKVKQQHPTAYVNDGAYGGTAMWAQHDMRQPDWLRAALPNGIPPGDALLVVDIDLHATAIETGVANPSAPATLVALAGVVAEHSPGIPPISWTHLLRSGLGVKRLQFLLGGGEVAEGGVQARSVVEALDVREEGA